MPRTARASIGDVCYHAFNRGNAMAPGFLSLADYQDFVDLIGRACRRLPLRVASELGLEFTLHSRGRPARQKGKGDIQLFRPAAIRGYCPIPKSIPPREACPLAEK